MLGTDCVCSIVRDALRSGTPLWIPTNFESYPFLILEIVFFLGLVSGIKLERALVLVRIELS
jgi:hypothetical protein